MMTTAQVVPAIDRYLPAYDVRSAHQIDVDASVTDTYRSVRTMDLGRSLPVMVLFAIRAIPHMLTGKAQPSRAVTLQTFTELGFVVLEENGPNEFVMGSIGKFWRPDSGLLRISAGEFASFDEPGYAKGILGFTVEERTPDSSILATETRVECTDRDSRRKFGMYWRAIGPFSGFIRHVMLSQVKRTAEAGAG